MKSPYYKVYLHGREDNELTEYVSRIAYEDCAEAKDSMVEFHIYKEKVATLLDDDNIKSGDIITFQFGFLGELPSELHKVMVKDVEAKYNESGPSLLLRCLDKGSAVKKNTSSKVWKNATTAEIVQAIAADYNMETVITGATKRWDNLPQGNRTDMAMLQYLADHEKDGNYIVFVRNDRLHFVRRGVDEASKQTYTWGEDSLIAFEPKYRESTKSQASNTTVAVAVDPFSKKTIREESSPDTEKDTTTLGEYKSFYDGFGNRTRTVLVVPDSDKDEVSNAANKVKKTAALNLLEATIRVEGNVTLGPNMVITIAGVANRYIGNWLIKEARHTIDGSGYLTTLKTVKDGSKTGKVQSKDKNTGKGPEQAQDTYKVGIYDKNGNRVRTETRTRNK